MKRVIKRAVIWLYCEGVAPAWFVRAMFSAFRLKSE